MEHLTYAHLAIIHIAVTLLGILIWPLEFIGDGKSLIFAIVYGFASVIGWVSYSDSHSLSKHVIPRDEDVGL